MPDGRVMHLSLPCPRCKTRSDSEILWWKQYPNGNIQYRYRCPCSPQAQSVTFKPAPKEIRAWQP